VMAERAGFEPTVQSPKSQFEDSKVETGRGQPRHMLSIQVSIEDRPHQFRTRNDRNEAQRTQANRIENAGKSTAATFIRALITVWLQVQVRSEPTAKSIAGQSPVCGRGGFSP
jgi:hypothetical protein